MRKKERKDVKELVDLILRCDRALHLLAKKEECPGLDKLIFDLGNNGITAMRLRYEKEGIKYE